MSKKARKKKQGRVHTHQTSITVMLPEAMVVEIEALAAADDRTRSNWIMRACRVALEKAKGMREA